uniref:Ferredoxin n=1 Tax=Bursaphelenchus xylophilus TaxID=6326 RepID=A0A1I7SPR6_BURXY
MSSSTPGGNVVGDTVHLPAEDLSEDLFGTELGCSSRLYTQDERYHLQITAKQERALGLNPHVFIPPTAFTSLLSKQILR